MRIREVSHERVRNIGNFESVRVTLTATLDADDDHREALATLKDEAIAFLYPNGQSHDEKPPPDSEDIPY